MNFLLHIIMIALNCFTILGFNLVLGKGKILHFGQEAQSLTAVYTTWVLITQYHFSWGVGILAGAVAVTLVSSLLAWLSFRLEPDGFGVMSIALHLAVFAVVLNWQSMTRGALGIPQIPRGFLPQSMAGFALLTVVLAALWITFLTLLDRGRFGRELSALAEHAWHAEALGIRRKVLHWIAFLIAGAGSLFAGIFYPPYMSLLSPTDYHFPALIFFITCVVAGGPGRVWGVVCSIAAIVFLKEGLRFIAMPADMRGPVQLILFGLILIIAVWYRRDTLFPKQRMV